jgi:hypothetical protein
MSVDNRQMPRIRDFARVKIKELCCLPCFLEEVSKTGCKVRISQLLEIDTDREYTLTVLPALHTGLKEFSLTVLPQWVRTDVNFVEIGFSVLHCPGIRQFARYVEILAGNEEAELQEA